MGMIHIIPVLLDYPSPVLLNHGISGRLFVGAALSLLFFFPLLTQYRAKAVNVAR